MRKNIGGFFFQTVKQRSTFFLTPKRVRTMNISWAHTECSKPCRERRASLSPVRMPFWAQEDFSGEGSLDEPVRSLTKDKWPSAKSWPLIESLVECMPSRGRSGENCIILAVGLKSFALYNLLSSQKCFPHLDCWLLTEWASICPVYL